VFWVIDRFAAAAVVFALVMAVFAAIWSARPVSLWLLVAWSAAVWAVPPAIQTLMLARAGHEHATAAMSSTGLPGRGRVTRRRSRVRVGRGRA
jgi:predicted MFS family arabinose efflux permease